MGRRCFLRGIACSTYDYNLSEGVLPLSLFRFPKDPTARAEWLKICGFEEGARVQKDLSLCSLHFTENDVWFNGRGCGLKRGAVPKVYSKDNVILIPQKPPPLIPMQRLNVACPQHIWKDISSQAARLKSKGNVQALISKRRVHRSSNIPSSPPPLALLDGKEIPSSLLKSLKDGPNVEFYYLSRLSVQPHLNQVAPDSYGMEPKEEKQMARLGEEHGAATNKRVHLQMENAKLKAELCDVKKDLRNVIENEARLRSKVECTLRRCDEKVKENCRLKALVYRMNMLADIDLDQRRWGNNIQEM